MFKRDEAKQLRLEFWDTFGRLSARKRAALGRHKKWMSYKTGLKGVELKFVLTRGRMEVCIEISHRNVYKRLEMYEKFEQVRTLIEAAYEHPLVWTDDTRNESGVAVCAIYEQQEGVDMYRKEQWPEIFEWFTGRMLLLEDAFEDVKPFLKAQWNEILFED